MLFLFSGHYVKGKLDLYSAPLYEARLWSAQVWITQSLHCKLYHTCLYLVSVHQMAHGALSNECDLFRACVLTHSVYRCLWNECVGDWWVRLFVFLSFRFFSRPGRNQGTLSSGSRSTLFGKLNCSRALVMYNRITMIHSESVNRRRDYRTMHLLPLLGNRWHRASCNILTSGDIKREGI